MGGKTPLTLMIIGFDTHPPERNVLGPVRRAIEASSRAIAASRRAIAASWRAIEASWMAIAACSQNPATFFFSGGKSSNPCVADQKMPAREATWC